LQVWDDYILIRFNQMIYYIYVTFYIYLDIFIVYKFYVLCKNISAAANISFIKKYHKYYFYLWNSNFWNSNFLLLINFQQFSLI